MAENENTQKDTKSDDRVWTCTVCGGHYLIMPVIIGQEYSVDNDTGQEFWGDIDGDDSDSVYVEDGNKTHAFCKTCGKETICELKPFKPAKIPGPNLIKDAYEVNDENLKSAGPVPDDAVIE